MGKQIVNTIGWTVILFVLLAAVNYFFYADCWLARTLGFVLPASVGYFFGYRQAQKDENR